jgi:hypothetical protein
VCSPLNTLPVQFFNQWPSIVKPFCERLHLTKLDVGIQRQKDGFAQRPIPDGKALTVINALASIPDVTKVSFVANPTAIGMLDLPTVDDKPELWADNQIRDEAAHQFQMQRIAVPRFPDAVMLMPLSTQSLLGVVF